MNRQPENITWNVMGMMNNSYFRIKVHRVFQNGAPALGFQHPTLAGQQLRGWVEEKVLGADKVMAAPAAAPKATGKKFAMSEIEKHDTKEDCWIVVKDKVYDATKYLDDHPGGAASILLAAGQDCTEEFEALHSSKAWKILEEYYIGDLEGSATGDKKISMPDVSAPTNPDPRQGQVGKPPAREEDLRLARYTHLPLRSAVEAARARAARRTAPLHQGQERRR